MTLKNVQRATLGLAIIAAGVLAAHSATPAAHAAASPPSITAIADMRTYGVLEVAGLGFGPLDPVQIQLIESSTGVWHTVASTITSRHGTFTKVFSVAVSCSAQAAGRVSIQAVDTATRETSASVLQTLGTPMTIANAQLASAWTPQQVASAQAAVAAARTTMLANAAGC